MAIEPWLPKNQTVAKEATVRRVLDGSEAWQIVELANKRICLLVRTALFERWIQAGLVDPASLHPVDRGVENLVAFTCSPDQAIQSLRRPRSPSSVVEALAFATSFSETRKLDSTTGLENGLYVESLSRILPTFDADDDQIQDDALILGTWLTGGLPISASNVTELQEALSWLHPANLKRIIEAAGLEYQLPASHLGWNGTDRLGLDTAAADGDGRPRSSKFASGGVFELPGRGDLSRFFNEHIIDILQNEDRYRSLGIGFPSAVILQGPPGCGKTFAVERLVEFLGWPSFSIDASSVASPYIHETSRKIAAVFDAAKEAAPSVLIIDEMEAFLADRDAAGGHHRVEEVGEFLRRIPEATAHRVLIFAMTNRLEMIDPAVIRRGRFDHILEVSYASKLEIAEMLQSRMRSLPTSEDVEIDLIAAELVGRPLSDVAFVVREGGRLAARSGGQEISQRNLLDAIASAPIRDRDVGEKRPIGFIWKTSPE